VCCKWRTYLAAGVQGLRPSTMRPLRRTGPTPDVLTVPPEVIEVLRWHVATQLTTPEQKASELLFPRECGRSVQPWDGSEGSSRRSSRPRLTAMTDPAGGADRRLWPYAKSRPFGRVAVLSYGYLVEFTKGPELI
jgi:hypothetical protein